MQKQEAYRCNSAHLHEGCISSNISKSQIDDIVNSSFSASGHTRVRKRCVSAKQNDFGAILQLDLRAVRQSDIERHKSLFRCRE